MNAEDIKLILRTIFIDWQGFGFIIGVIVPLAIYWLSKKDSTHTLESNRRRDSDKNQIDEIIGIFRNILTIFNTNSSSEVDKSLVPPDLLSKLKIEIQLVACFDNEIKEKIGKNICKECAYYNELSCIKFSKISFSTESNDVEKEKRELIERNIIEIVKEVKKVYSEV